MIAHQHASAFQIPTLDNGIRPPSKRRATRQSPHVQGEILQVSSHDCCPAKSLSVENAQKPSKELHSTDYGGAIEPYGGFVNAGRALHRTDSVRCIG